MSGHREEHLGLCAGYALGALDEPERRVLEQHLAEGCPDCEAELARLAEGVTLVAASAPPATPSPALKIRVLERVRSQGVVRSARAPGRVVPMTPRRRPGPLTWAFAAAAAALVVTSAALWQASERLRTDLAAAHQQLDGARHELATREQQLADAQKWSALLEGASTRVVDFQLTPQGKGLIRARAVYDPQAHRAMIVFTNFTPPSGADYQLWALRDGKPASLGVIHADADGRAIVRLPDTGDPASLGAFAVSLEKTGGSTSPAAPQGPVIMVGKLAGS